MRTAARPLGLALLLAAAPGAAEGPGPVLPKALGERCVEPVQAMRERHWQFLLHQRDETVHRGVRTERHSLQNCLECHVPRDPGGGWARAREARHFCTACHVYAAVRLDCFECHADRPRAAYSAAPGPAALTRRDLERARRP